MFGCRSEQFFSIYYGADHQRRFMHVQKSACSAICADPDYDYANDPGLHAVQLSMMYCPGQASQCTAAHWTLTHLNGIAQQNVADLRLHQALCSAQGHHSAADVMAHSSPSLVLISYKEAIAAVGD